MRLAAVKQPILSQIFGNRPVAFLANARDEPTSDLALDMIADRYGGRDLVSLRPGDKAIFPANQLACQRAHIAYLNRHGFGGIHPNA